MPPARSSACIAVGVTNARLGADKRGIAVELARRLAFASPSAVCLVGADPTDRDVERRTPQLVEASGHHAHSQITQGPHTLDIRFMSELRVCTVSVSDRAVLDKILPDLRARFRFIVIDGPSRVGYGVGIAHVLLGYLDGMIVASGPSAGDLAVARGYLAGLDRLAAARHVDVRVLISGQPHESGLSAAQLERRSAALPTLGWVPHLWGRNAGTPDPEQLDAAFRPIIGWIIERQHDNPSGGSEDLHAPTSQRDARQALQSARAASAYGRSE